MSIRSAARTALAAFLVLGVVTARARADGDPASDYLLSNQVFLSAQTTAPSSPQRSLEAVVAAANRAGFPIRVAVIPSQYDLGSITELWRRPALYARFLGLELGQSYSGRLLVVMPNGLGFSWAGHPSARIDGILAKVPIAADLDMVAAQAVRRLAAADEVSIPATSPRRSGSSALTVLSALAAGLVGAILLFRIARAGLPARAAAAISLPRGWAVPGLAALFVAAGGAPIVLIVSRRPSSTSQAAVGDIITPPALSWPAATKRAPDFVLSDQDGHPVSLAAFRGRQVILTFTDPLCRNLCPLEAHLLNAVVGQMPGAQRPAIIAVSVDINADTRADLLQNDRQWHLVPQWHWAVGRPAALAGVWNDYQVGVRVVTKHVGGLALRYITHSEVAFVIDQSGYMRALFLWPFYPQDLQHTLRSLYRPPR